MNEKTADVCVVGAGFSGLMCAKRLHDAGKSVVVLEARNRLGGRTYTEEIGCGGISLDVGGQWIGPSQKRINKLATDFKTPIFPTFCAGKNLLNLNGKRTSYSGTIPKINPIALIELGIAMKRLDKLALQINVEKPWESKNAEKFDSISLEAWIISHVKTSSARALLSSGLEMIFSTNPRKISFLYALYVIKICDGLDILFGVENGAQQDRFLNGTQEVIAKMSKPFENSLFVNEAVKAINQESNHVNVIASTLQVKAKRVVVAIPPILHSNIEFSPNLSPQKSSTSHAMLPGAVIKFLVIYKNPFWRNKKLSGQIVSPSRQFFTTFDNSLPNKDVGILVAFAIADNAIDLQKLSFEKRKVHLVNYLVSHFGSDAAHPLHVAEHVWADEAWSGGAFFGVLPTGILSTDGREFWKPMGKVHWAGTETAREWLGYIEGALEAGERAASEVLALL